MENKIEYKFENCLCNLDKNKEAFDQLSECFVSDSEILDKFSYLNVTVGNVIKDIDKFTNNICMKVLNKNSLLAQYSFPKDSKFIISKKEIGSLLTRNISVTIFHHTDLDGYGSASIIYHALKHYDIDRNITMCPYNFSGDLLDNTITNEYIKNETKDNHNIAFVVDLSLRDVDLVSLLGCFDKVIFIDHHSSSLSTVNSLNKFIDADNHNFVYAVDIRFSATYLVFSLFKQFDYLFPDSDLTLNSLLFAGYSMIYDIRDNINYPTEYVYAEDINQYFKDMKLMEPNSDVWVKIWKASDNSAVNRLIAVGKKLRDINNQKLKLIKDSDVVYKISYKGLTVYAMHGYGNSSKFCLGPNEDVSNKIFLIINKNKYEIFCTMYTDDSKVKSRINLGLLCKKMFFNGGHAGAAGTHILENDLQKLISIFPFTCHFDCLASYKNAYMLNNELMKNFTFTDDELILLKSISDKAVTNFDESNFRFDRKNADYLFFYAILLFFYGEKNGYFIN